MNTDAIDVADVWNRLLVDKGRRPWADLPAEEQAAALHAWKHMDPHKRRQWRQAARGDLAPVDRQLRPVDDAALQRAVDGIQAGIREALKGLDLPEWLAASDAVSGAELEALLVDPDVELDGRRIVNDALVYGEVDGALLDREIILGSGASALTARGRWKNWKTTVYDLLDKITVHKEGLKDGACLLQGPVIDGVRQANAIPHLDLLILDLDTGESIDAIRQRLMDEELFGIIYSTHSHMKAVSDVKRDEVIRWIGGEVEEPDIAQVCEYLRERKRYQPAVLEGAELLPTEHTSGGVMLKVKHQPMPKFRVVMVLKERFVVAEKALLQRDAIADWKAAYAGASKLLGAYFDRSCTDPSRLFYTPRHPKGATNFRIEVVAGKPLDLDKVERISAEELRRESESPFEAAAKAMGGGSAEYTTTGLKWFFAKYGDRFEVDEFLMEVDGEGDRGPRNGPGRHHRCPNDDAHTDAGNPDDKGFFVVNASDDETAVAHCMHDSCSRLDRINFVDLACQAAGIKDATELKKWVPDTVEDDEEEEVEEKAEEKKPEVKAYKNPAEAKRAINDLSDDDGDVARGVIGKIAASKFSPTELASLKKLLVNKTSFGMKVINDEIKRAKPADEEEVYDDELRAELAKMNRDYAAVLMGGKFRIMMEPGAPGRAPDMVDRDTFNAWFENKKVGVLDEQGNRKLVSVGKLWRDWGERREYRRVVFKPGRDTPGEYNIWKGLAACPKRGDWSLMRSHILDNICQSNQGYFDWLMTWMAQLLQHPGEKLGSAVVVRGKKGVGKSKLFEWLRKALGEHALKVSRSAEIVGGFNQHQQGIVLLVCEEAFWAGDKQAGGALKDIITSDEMLLTPKGIDSMRFENFMRLVMISNEDWVVPAGLDDERRFFVVECGDAHRNDIPYFAAIDRQMKAGGLEAMVADLLAWRPTMFPLGWDVLRTPPETPWLAEQGRQDMSPAERFVVHVVQNLLQAGEGAAYAEYELPSGVCEPLRFQTKTETTLPVGVLMTSFVEWMRWTGETNRSRKADEMALAKAVKKVLGATSDRTTGQRFYVCPAVPVMQENANKWLKLPHEE